jgi:molecular chaperone HscC
VDIRVNATGATRRLVIENQPGVLSPKEIEDRLAALTHLKMHPREQTENQAVLARAERLYAERLGEERMQVAARLDHFRAVLERQIPAEIEARRDELTAWLDVIDVSFFI